MLLNFIINNFKVFSSEVNLSLEADLRTKKLISNVITNPQGNALKSVAIYGPNNTGKTCVIDAMGAYKSVLLNRHLHLSNNDINLFSDSKVIKLGAEFLFNGSRYEYIFCFDNETKTFCKEKFTKIVVDQYGNQSREVYFYKNTETKETASSNTQLNEVINLSSKDNILIYSLDTSNFPLLQEAKDVLQGFAKSIFVVSMEHLSPTRTIEVLKDPMNPEAQQIVDLIKNADLDIDDFRYENEVEVKLSNSDKQADNILKENIDSLKLMSIHHGQAVPSIIFDSLGTRKIVSLASYVVEVLNHGGTLFLDELDSGIHFKLSRAIVSLFNNIANESAQLVCTTHDVSLLDIKTLFRKEQLWFTDKDDTQAYLYSLADFSANDTGIRSETNLYERYSKGLLGALPDPSLVDFLLLKKGGNSDE